ncbi:MAG: hypothetical protein IM597_12635 [Pseudanabaena sp. M176S2SP2A07QC]|nr:hypothetical protein [Pseudanabaena sp. M090S1SP2A07QC]MCA6507747.1 hypothetical protein [Pseudanabaena sp. M172S2SP2A07QC]MCA6534981.1 hypothetical protein [Pseudanabaena sp. M176S2SP2A07QC]MCA6566047.1 hypothetical protein [Pseudanabaena sp. M151S2SP2A07QC]MCA6578352.1 hypothetical protein [Pseudanabaena sp. M085S1SP2A07QC]
MAELRSAIFWVLNCPIYLLRCYIRRCPNTWNQSMLANLLRNGRSLLCYLPQMLLNRIL